VFDIDGWNVGDPLPLWSMQRLELAFQGNKLWLIKLGRSVLLQSLLEPASHVNVLFTAFSKLICFFVAAIPFLISVVFNY
jgi:hypothetical protein